MKNNKPNIAVDPQMEPVLEQMKRRMAERGQMGSASPDVMRERFRADISRWNKDPPDLPRVIDGVIDTPGGPQKYRLYDPLDNGSAMPCMVYFHGGGWIVGDYLCNDKTMRLLALQSGVAILSADYRLAPENKFPAGLDDCVAVMRWVHEHGELLGLDPERLAITGDSAGGNLALATALELRNDQENWLRLVLIIYACLSPNSDTESQRLFGGGDFGMGTAALAFFWAQYLAQTDQELDPRAVPLLADMAGLPPVHIISAGLDPLRDDSYALEHKLTEAGIPCNHICYPGVVHGFMSMTNMLDIAQTATSDAARVIADAMTGDNAVTSSG